MHRIYGACASHGFFRVYGLQATVYCLPEERHLAVEEDGVGEGLGMGAGIEQWESAPAHRPPP